MTWTYGITHDEDPEKETFMFTIHDDSACCRCSEYVTPRCIYTCVVPAVCYILYSDFQACMSIYNGKPLRTLITPVYDGALTKTDRKKVASIKHQYMMSPYLCPFEFCGGRPVCCPFCCFANQTTTHLQTQVIAEPGVTFTEKEKQALSLLMISSNTPGLWCNDCFLGKLNPQKAVVAGWSPAPWGGDVPCLDGGMGAVQEFQGIKQGLGSGIFNAGDMAKMTIKFSKKK